MNIVELLNKLKKNIEDPAVAWALGVLGGLVMVFTPDHVDLIIEAVLGILGVKVYMSLKKK